MHNRVRIIGGTWRSRVLRFAPLPGLRPTPDRVRETVFNWLGQDLTGKTTLELFAGTAVFSFEALSRGAVRAVCVEHNARALADVRENAQRLGTQRIAIRRADVLDFLRDDADRYDVIFVDPPYGEEWASCLWPLLAPRLNEGGWLYLETPTALASPPGWEIWRRDKAGQVHYHLLRCIIRPRGDNDGGHHVESGLPGDVRSFHQGP
jgi:16S rRNA (guanine966-N2)-methyltransferase